MSNPIREWLNGNRAYAIGLALFETYGQDELLLRALRQGHSQYRHERMISVLRELQPLADRLPAAPVNQEPQHEEITVGAADLPEKAVPEAKDPYRQDWLPFYMEMNALRAKLLLITSDKERGKAAHRILDLERTCMRWWERRDYFIEHGTEYPEAAPVAEEVVSENVAHRALTNARANLSKARKNLADGIRLDTAQARIDKYSAMVTTLETMLQQS